MTTRIQGVLAPVLVPFKADLSPDPERLIAHCKWLLSQHCGLAVFGTTSEANSLSAEERINLLDALIAAGADPSRMMAGTGCCSITETVNLTSHAVKHGCAGVLMLPPFYYKSVSEEGLFRYFSEVIQRVGDSRLRVYLYHIPPVAIVGLTPKLVERLLNAYPDAIAGMKDSSGDWNNTKMYLDAFVQRAFGVFVGSESFLLANMRSGGVGTISATANVNPAAIYKLYAECAEEKRAASPTEGGDGKLAASPTARDEEGNQTAHPPSREATARQGQAQLDVVREVFTKFPMIPALKQAIAMLRKDPSWARVRPPLIELTTSEKERLVAELKAIRFGVKELRVDS